jgi:hypothetical protein
MSSAEQTVRSEPSASREVPQGLMLVGLLALLSSVGILLGAGADLLLGQGPDENRIAQALTVLYAVSLAVAGCRLWHGSLLALDFLLISGIAGLLLPTLPWSLLDLLKRGDLLPIRAAAGIFWLGVIVYLIRWRDRWHRE